jgi:hypothetical protein
MTDADSQSARQQSRRRPDGGDHRPERPPEAPEDRSFSPEHLAAGDLIAPNPMTIGPGLEVEHEAVQLGQEMIRAGERAFNEAMTVWRRSLEPFAEARAAMSGWYEDVLRQTTGFGAMRHPARPTAGAAAARPKGRRQPDRCAARQGIPRITLPKKLDAVERSTKIEVRAAAAGAA